jgi:hypothetical protein
MSYSWDEIKEVIETVENERVINEFSLLEQGEGYLRTNPSLTEKHRIYLEFLGELSVGFSVGVFSLIFNFMLFVWLLHIEF